MYISSINSINNSYVANTYKNRNKPNQLNKNLSFQAKKDIVLQVEKVALGDKLAAIFKRMKINDVIVVAKDISKVEAQLKSFVDKLKSPINRILFLRSDKTSEVIFFTMNEKGEKTIHNSNSLPFFINGDRMVLPNKSSELEYGDRIRMFGKWIEYKKEPTCEVDLEKHLTLFSRVYDYTTLAKKSAHSHNMNVLLKMYEKPKEKKHFVTFKDIGGHEEIIEALKRNLLYPMRYPEVFEGLMNCKGAILYGLPGTGKTYLAEAFINEAGASSFSISATELSAKYVGESEKNCRDLFKKAVDAQPSVIYIDEFEALGKSRGGNDVHGDKLLNQFLSCTSDIEKNGDKVVIIASTNRKEDLDPAILRSGRFDLQLEIKSPDLVGTRQVLDLKTEGKKLADDVDKDELSKLMYDAKMTQADITATVRNAHINALVRTGIFKSMDDNKFSPIMMDYFSINKEDFLNAINSFKLKNTRRKIGY